MDIHQLKSLVTVAREGSITRASDLLFLSQPAVSAHIKAMEDALCLKLFSRSSRGMNLTADGRALLPRAQHVIAMYGELAEEARRRKGGVQGVARIGAPPGAAPAVLARLVLLMGSRCPEIEVRLVRCNSAEAPGLLDEGLLDAALFFDGEPLVNDLDTLQVDRFGIQVVAPRRWVASPRAPDWNALSGRPWVFAASNSCCGRAAEALFARFGIRPSRLIHADHEDLVRLLVAEGVGVGLLHRDGKAPPPGQESFDLVGDVQYEGRLLFGSLSRRGGDPVLQSVTSVLREVLGELLDAGCRCEVTA